MRNRGAGPNDPMLSSGYSAGTKAAFVTIGVVGTSLLGAGFVNYPDRVNSSTVLLAVAIVTVWACALLDAFNRRIWLLNDHIVYRNLLWCQAMIYYRDVTEMKEGGDRVILNATGGRSVTILRRMEHFHEIAFILASRTGHVRSNRQR